MALSIKVVSFMFKCTTGKANKFVELCFIYDISLWMCGGVVVHIISLQWQCSRAATFGPFCYAPHSHDLDNNIVLNIRGMDMMSAFVLLAIPYKWMFAFIYTCNCIALLNVLNYSRIKNFSYFIIFCENHFKEYKTRKWITIFRYLVFSVDIIGIYFSTNIHK